MPSARYSISRLAKMSVVGAKPRSTEPQSGSAMAICTAKHAAITPSIATTKASIQRKPNVGRGDDHADLERNMKQEIEADGGADHLGQISGGDRDLRRQP